MNFCIKCGQQLSDGVNFCANCGQKVNYGQNTNCESQKTVFEGELYKCPSCGEVLKSFCIECPACGYELRGVKNKTAIEELYKKLSNTTYETQRISIIQTFNVPNTREDIIEFMRLAVSSFDANIYVSHMEELDISDAWLAKAEQCYYKAKRSFKNEEDLREISELYEKLQSQRREKEDEYKQEQEEKRLEKKRQEIALNFKCGKFKFFIIGMIVIASILSLVAFFNGRFISGVISIVSIVVALIGILMALNIIKEKFLYLHVFIFVFSLALVLPYFALFNNHWQINDLNPNVIVIGVDCDELIKNNFTELEDILLDKGFSNISIKEIPWSENIAPGDVLSLSIDGQTKFKATKRFYIDSPVIISLAGQPINRQIGLNHLDLLGLKYQEAAERLAANGFANIQYNKLPWEDGVDIEKVVSVSINGNNTFTETDEFLENVNVVIQYYEPPKSIVVGHYDFSLRGKILQDVENIFASLGFVNIKLSEVDWEAKATSGCVSRVTINGDDDFSNEDAFTQDAIIIIYYYGEPKQIKIDFLVDDLKGKHYDDVEIILNDLGFVNIEIVEKSWNLFQKSGNVKTVLINGKDEWNTGDAFSQNSKIVIEYYK